MRVLDTEAVEDYGRRAIREVVVVHIGIPQQLRGREYPDAVAAAADGGGEVQTVDEGGDFGERAVTFYILVNGDAVAAFKRGFFGSVVGWRRFFLVIADAPDAVAGHEL